MKRRGFIRKVAIVMASVAGAIAGIGFLRQLSPKATGKGKRYKVGKVSDFPVDTFTFIPAQKIYIYRDHESMKAVSAVCTHLGCTVQHTIDGFECPCHGSFFTDEGEVISGPAPRALSWYLLEKMPDGTILVDMDVLKEPEEKLYIS